MSLTFDALGRHASRTASGVSATYAYAGESSAIVAITPASGPTITSALDPSGARLAMATSTGGFGSVGSP